MALGNGPWTAEIVELLAKRLGENSLLDKYIEWMLRQQNDKRLALAVEVQPVQQKRLVRAVEKGLLRNT